MTEDDDEDDLSSYGAEDDGATGHPTHGGGDLLQ